jgi:hypothetical protein
MSLELLALAGAVSFLCTNPTHHDGDNVRCADLDRTIRLQGIDAPEMPGACRPGRDCTPGNAFAARDYLRSLTRGHTVQCAPDGNDQYGRIIARCAADGVDLSCAMIAAGHAVPRYAAIDCGSAAATQGTPEQRADRSDSPPPSRLAEAPVIIAPANLPARAVAESGGSGGLTWLVAGLLWLGIVNAGLWRFACRRWPGFGENPVRWEPVNLPLFQALALIGGSPAAMVAVWLRDPGEQLEALERPLTLIVGLHVGVVIGLLWWWLAG